MIAEGSVTAKPFVKWAGGKGRLVPQLKQLLPEKFGVYYEPFVGGGALFFGLADLHRAYLNDINEVLISAYRELQSNVDGIVAALQKLETQYLVLGDEERQAFYYDRRTEYNAEQLGLRKTILLLFLNRTCFNGLYRENSKGEFNVPFGRYKNPSICNEPNLRAIADRLQYAVITAASYKDAVASAKKGDFIYLDPPYQPLSQTSFTAYHQDGFTAADQAELRDLFVELDKRGCFVMLSNSSAELVHKLYSGYRIETVLAARSINSKASARGKVKELVVMNY